MPFYHFSQNNSGGAFDLTDKLTHHVIVEAESAERANDKLESLGGYFDGCESDRDCPCCGDRWYPAWSSEGCAEPMVYDTKPQDHGKGNNRMLWMEPGKNVVVHYADGRVEWF